MPLSPVRAAAKAGVPEKNDQKRLVKTKGSVAEAYREPTLDIARIRIAGPEMPMFDLNGIMFLENGPKAIINNVVVEEGDVISGALVAEIHSQNVLLKFDDSEITLKLK